MSEENVELTRRAFEAITHRDRDALLALTDPDVVAEPRTLGVEGGAVHGHDGIRKWWDGVFSAFPDFAIEAIEVRGTDDVTLASVRVRGHGQGSGAPFEDAVWIVCRVRDGKVFWWKTFESEGEALGAAGLQE